MMVFLKGVQSKIRRPRLMLLLAILACLLFAAPLSLSAQDEEEGQVQVLTGRLFLGETLQYDLPDLQQADTLYVEMSNVSGNLDPTLLLSTPDVFSEELVDEMLAELEDRVVAGDDQVVAMRDILLANLLAGNDNYASNSTAAIEYEIPEDGDYLLLALSALTNETEGEYELVVGLNAPEVLQGQGRDTGDEIAFLDREGSGIETAVQEIWGELTDEQRIWNYSIPHVDSDDTLYAYVETTSGDLVPVLELQDYSGRTLRLANSTGQQKNASFEFPVMALTDNFRIVVRAWGEEAENFTTGVYRLVVGTNEATVLSGEVEPTGRDLVSETRLLERLRVGDQEHFAQVRLQHFAESAVLEHRFEALLGLTVFRL